MAGAASPELLSDRNVVTAREYLRVSMDRSGRQRSVNEQHDDNERAAVAHGLQLGEPYREARDVSASRYSRKVRGGFAALLADLENDRFGADALVLWESSRGSRRVGEWVTLIELCEERGVQVFVTTHGRAYDPSNARDRRSLLEDAVDSEYESAKVSTRAKRAAASNAAAGRPNGSPPLGYRAVYDPRTGRLLNWEPHPDEAPLVVELFRRLAAGHSLRAIARDWKTRGILNDSGTPYSSQHLRQTALRVTYIGKRSHRGEITEATWPAIVDESVFWQVQRIITAPERVTTRHGRAVHELSMIIRCDVCGGPLVCIQRRGRTEYRCQRHSCIHIPQRPVDELITAAMLDYLARPDVYDAFATTTGGGEQVQRVRGELAKARAELDELHDALGKGEISVRMAARAEPQIEARIASLEYQERELSTPSALHSFMAPGDDVSARWKTAPISTRREVARILLSPDYLGEVRITRCTVRGHRVDVADRIEWRRS